jgi:hypothetical protein
MSGCHDRRTPGRCGHLHSFRTPVRYTVGKADCPACRYSAPGTPTRTTPPALAPACVPPCPPCPPSPSDQHLCWAVSRARRSPGLRYSVPAARLTGRRQRDVAQLGSALDWGSRGRGFESRRPDTDEALTSGNADQGFDVSRWRFEPPPENPPQTGVGNQVSPDQGALVWLAAGWVASSAGRCDIPPGRRRTIGGIRVLRRGIAPVSYSCSVGALLRSFAIPPGSPRFCDVPVPLVVRGGHQDESNRLLGIPGGMEAIVDTPHARRGLLVNATAVAQREGFDLLHNAADVLPTDD